MTDFDEADALKALIREAKRLALPVTRLGAIRPGAADAIAKLAAAVDGLPEPEVVAQALQELRSKSQDVIKHALEQRTQEMGRFLVEFIGRARQQGIGVRESVDGWRVGPLYLQLDRRNAKARAHFNRELISAWTSIGCAEHLAALWESSQGRLAAGVVDGDLFDRCLMHAYEQGLAVKKAAAAARVAMPDLYRELRLALIDAELNSGKPDRKLAFGEFPRWRFLYNLDLYRERMAGSRSGLGFETGSQHDQERQYGVVLNGLEALSDYKTYCYAVARG